MNKRVFIVHQWFGNPNSDWYPWLKNELEKFKYGVIVFPMPNPNEPKINEWIATLKNSINNLRTTDIFVGHSVGCQTILRFLENLPNDLKIAKVIMVAGWFSLTNLGDEEIKIAKPWLETPIAFEKIKKKVSSFTAIFSDNDPYVPLKKNSEIFGKQLGAKIIVEKNKGHFSESAGITQLPIALKSVLEIAG